MFGAGGGTSSYREAEETDLIILWGSNARETHPIFFHHVLKAVRNGARLIAVDPRRTTSAEFADIWLGLDVGSDISLANAMAREIIHAGLADREFIGRATTGYDDYARCVEAYPLERAEKDTGIPGDVIKEVAHAYARADRGMICWTLGITEHHNAVDNVLALINLALLTGKVGRYGCGLNPLRGQNNVQGGGDMGAIPNRLTGFQDLEDAELRGKFEKAWGGVRSSRRPARATTSTSSRTWPRVSDAIGAGRRPSKCGTSFARYHRCIRACRTGGSTSWAASSGLVLTSPIQARSSSTAGSGRTRWKGRWLRSAPSSSSRLSTS